MGSIVILTILSPIIHEQGCFLISVGFKNFWAIMVFFLKFLPKYLILFNAAVNGIIFFYFFFGLFIVCVQRQLIL